MRTKAYTVRKGVTHFAPVSNWSYDHQRAIAIEAKLKYAYRTHSPADPNTLNVDRDMLKEYMTRRNLLWQAGTVKVITWKEAVLARLEGREAEYTTYGT